MHLRTRIILAIVVGLALGNVSQAAAPISYDRQVKPILVEFCWDCHGDGAKKGGLALDTHADMQAMLADRQMWKHVMDNLQQRVMPPDRKPQPTQEQRDLIIHWVEAEIFKTDCDNPDPGRVTIRRLNRVEYNNTIRDLVGVDFQPADDFPADDSGYGFDNIGDVLSLPPIMLEKYMAAAEKILNQAIVTSGGTRPKIRHGYKELQGGTSTKDIAKILSANGEISIDHNFTQTGEYVFRVRAFQHKAGPEAAKMTVRIEGKDLKTFDVPADEDSPAVYEVRSRVNAGRQKVAAAFLNDFYQKPPGNGPALDRNLLVIHIEIEGPMDVEPDLPETHQRIFVAKPNGSDKLTAARTIVGQFMRRAYRRPVTPEEVGRPLQIFSLADRNGESFERAIQLTLQAVLVSPHFLFRGEIQPEPDNPQRNHPINEFALASRLSYFLWSSMPDEQLFDMASRNQLRRNLAAQVNRMLRDTRARALVENFGGQWLMLRNLDIVTPDPKAYPNYDDTLKVLMRKETEMLFEHIMREDRNIFEFLSADYTFINERLADHYGVPGVQGDKFQRISLEGTPRRGVLTHASILTLTSNPTRTSPVKRGLFVLENLLATPPPPAPPDVPPLDEEGGKLTGTLREQMEKHRDNPACASCHARMDPLGFGLENFDAVGAWRDQENKVPIDPSGKLVTGENFKGPVELNKILVESKRKEFVHSLSEKMLTYGLGRGLEFYDKCALEEIAKGLDRNGYRFSALILEIVKSVPFQLRRGEGDRTAAGSQ